MPSMKTVVANLRWMLLGALVVASMFIFYAVLSEERGDTLTVAFLDVGQGDAVYIEAPSGNQMLVDGGRGGEVLRALAGMMPVYDRSIDVVVATHPDADHIGGLPRVLRRYDVDFVLRSGAANDTSVYRTFEGTIQETAITPLLARRGMRVNLGGGVYVDILFPDRDVGGVNPNDASVVARLVYGDIEVLLTGDAPKAIERYLVSLDGRSLSSDVLKVGHHGSKTSSDEQFVGFVSPQHAVISAGCDNRYGHPHGEVIDTLTSFDVAIVGTCEQGTVVFETDGKVLMRK